MRFTKMHGNGNDFIVVEDFANYLLGKEKDLSIRLCNRNFGIGGDGLILLRKSNVADVRMDIFNADGSYASMCGNGIRCFAKYVYSENIYANNCIRIETGDGIKEALLKVENNIVTDITINMGQPLFHSEIFNEELLVEGRKYTITAVHIGVPHAVVFGVLDNFDIYEGKNIEKHSMFPEGTNINFCEVVSESEIKVKTWERGVGPTLACGTGSCASVIAANKMGLVNKEVQVYLPGGSLRVAITNDGVMMTGPAEVVFKGEMRT